MNEKLKLPYQLWIGGIALSFVVSAGLFIGSSVSENWSYALATSVSMSLAVGILIWYLLIQLWDLKFVEDEKDVEKKRNPYRGMFFNAVNTIALILLGVGLFASLLVIAEGKLYSGAALFLAVVWVIIFLRYFLWAVYFYNINYGLTDLDWQVIFEKRKRAAAGEYFKPEELQGPEENPYRNQTFGLPAGTVRGMIAFTLLFSGIALMLAGFDLEGGESTFVSDHFEFFRTAFIMMIAFYFGDSALRYLKREKDASTGQGNAPTGDKDGLESESRVPATAAPKKPLPTAVPDVTKSLKDGLNEVYEKRPGLIPIIDAGHGGMKDGKYTTGKKKMYEFDDGTIIHEGVVNREIGARLIDLLNRERIPFYDLTVKEEDDISLEKRVKEINEQYGKDPRYYVLSLHSNAASKSIKGAGSKAHGFEIWTSKGETRSDEIADVFARYYKASFKRRFRQDMSDGDTDKERSDDQLDLFILRKTACPAVLVENLFYDNLEEAKFLQSKEGQQQIAECLMRAVQDIYTNMQP